MASFKKGLRPLGKLIDTTRGKFKKLFTKASEILMTKLWQEKFNKILIPTSTQSIWGFKVITVRVPPFLWKLASVLKQRGKQGAEGKQ